MQLFTKDWGENERDSNYGFLKGVLSDVVPRSSQNKRFYYSVHNQRVIRETRNPRTYFIAVYNLPPELGIDERKEIRPYVCFNDNLINFDDEIQQYYKQINLTNPQLTNFEVLYDDDGEILALKRLNNLWIPQNLLDAHNYAVKAYFKALVTINPKVFNKTNRSLNRNHHVKIFLENAKRYSVLESRQQLRTKQHHLIQQEQAYSKALQDYTTTNERLSTEIERVKQINIDTVVSGIEGLHWIKETKRSISKLVFVTKPLTLGNLQFGTFTITFSVNDLAHPRIETNTRWLHPYKFKQYGWVGAYAELARKGCFCLGDVYLPLFEKAIRNLNFNQALQILYRVFTNYEHASAMQKIGSYLAELNYTTERKLIKGLFPELFESGWVNHQISAITDGLVKITAQRRIRNRDFYEERYEVTTKEKQLELGWINE